MLELVSMYGRCPESPGSVMVVVVLLRASFSSISYPQR